MAEKVVIGNAELWHGDCREVLPLLPSVDLVLTDPPYGIGADKGKNGNRAFKGGKRYESAFHPENTWDNCRPADDLIVTTVKLGAVAIVWGGNYFADLLPATGRWLWWDKCQTMPSYGDGELAWTNLPQSTPKKFVLANNKLLADRVERFHPTQKPLQLMEWCLSFVPDAFSVCDPFMGSGTTGVACARMGLQFTGVERERKYFDIACERIENAYRQGQMFPIDIEPAHVQDALL